MGTLADRESQESFIFVTTTTLHDVLMKSYTTNDCSKRLNTCSRALLALRLASSLLQLLATPWTARSWSSENILLLVCKDQHDSQTSCGGTIAMRKKASELVSGILVDRPVLTYAVPPTGACPDKHDAKVIRRLFLELGIMMLELHYQMPLKAWCESRGHGISENDYIGRWYLAKRWIEES